MCHFQNNFVKFLGIIYLIHNTQLCKLRLWHMSRFSARSHEWFRERFPWRLLVQAAAENCGPVLRWPDCSASRSQPTPPNRVQIFFFFCWVLGLLGSNTAANRRPQQAGSGHHSTGPWARGKHPPCGFPLLTNIKDLVLVFGRFCTLFVHHFILVNKITF